MIRILSIEDDLKIQEAIITFLQSKGYQVYKASNAIDGLNILAHEKIDILLLDLGLEDISGQEILAQ
ncbi:MAG: response regulator, partial [Bacilli bacterium]